MKEIPLSQGKVALVDDGDFEWLMKWKWFAEKRGHTWYARRTSARAVGKRNIYMHRQIMDFPPKVDHRDRDGLHNWRGNLRTATAAQNLHNARMRSDCTTGFKGVNKHSSHQRKKIWQARLERKSLGYYSTKEEAASAHDKAALKQHGEFAYLNFPKEKPCQKQ